MGIERQKSTEYKNLPEGVSGVIIDNLPKIDGMKFYSVVLGRIKESKNKNKVLEPMSPGESFSISVMEGLSKATITFLFMEKDIAWSKMVDKTLIKEQGFDTDEGGNIGKRLSPELSQMLYDLRLKQGQFE